MGGEAKTPIARGLLSLGHIRPGLAGSAQAWLGPKPQGSVLHWAGVWLSPWLWFVWGSGCGSACGTDIYKPMSTWGFTRTHTPLVAGSSPVGPTTLLTVASRFITTYTPGQWLFLLDHGRPNQPPRLTGIGELIEVAFEIGHAADPIVTSPRCPPPAAVPGVATIEQIVITGPCLAGKRKPTPGLIHRDPI